MKRIIVASLMLISLVTMRSFCAEQKKKNPHFTGAFTAGYVFKDADHTFKEVYGLGMANAITFDGCYTPCKSWGIGAKVSYWIANGQTTFLKLCTSLQEVPITAYLRGMFKLKCNLELYASLGGGAIWMQEKSYLGRLHRWAGIGEVEFGLNYPVWRWFNFTSAFRILFPSHGNPKRDVGGYDLRGGFGFSF